MNAVIALISCLLLSSCAYADTLNVAYSKFYSHVKKLDGEDTSALQFAFGFSRVGEERLCEIKNVSIVTDKKIIPIAVSPEGRFIMPSDNILKMAEANVAVDLIDSASACDMSVQLETKPDYLKTFYSREELRFLIDQYRSFFNEMGSFLSFMMPSVEGLTFQFADKNLTLPVSDAPPITMGRVTLTESWIQAHQALSLPQTPLRITAKAS